MSSSSRSLGLVVAAVLVASCASVATRPKPPASPPNAARVTDRPPGSTASADAASSASNEGESAWPCAKSSRDRITPDCFQPDPDQRARVGRRCELHPGSRLLPDTVRIGYGFVGSARSGELPGVTRNARLEASGGCVVGLPWTEVAYCPECRGAWLDWEKSRTPGH